MVMRRSLAISLIAALSLCFCPQMHAGRSDTLSFHLSFPQGVSSLERGVDGNAAMMDGLLAALNLLNEDPQYIIKSVNICTAASPEGGKPNNERLSRARARSILDFLMDGTTLSPSQVKVNSRGENWEGLMDILMSCREPWRDEALKILAGSGVLSSDSGSASSRCKQQLRTLEEGRAWEWMEENAFSQLRSADGRVLVVTFPPYEMRSRTDTLVIRHEDVIVHRDTVYNEVLSQPFRLKKTAGFRRDSSFRIPVMAFRSNLLMPLMNIGVEVPLSNRFSLGADWYCPWAFRNWSNRVLPSQMYCAQMLFGSIEARWWLGRLHSQGSDPKYRLRGHSIGLVGIGGYYDLEYDGKGQQGEFYGLGLDYMYSLPLGKGGAHMEFSLGAGCVWNPYRNYQVRTEGGYLTADGGPQSRFMPVPLRVGISLSIPVTKRKEEQR